MGQTAKAYSYSLYHAFENVLTFYESSQLPYGIIVASTKAIHAEQLRELKKLLAKEMSAADVHCVYEEHNGVLAVLLGDQMLSSTHFYSLCLKEYLQARHLLAGQMLIASVPEQGESVRQILAGMVQEIKANGEVAGDIRIYTPGQLDIGQKPRILLVSHDETINQFLHIYLQKKGYRVYVATDGRQGMEKFLEFSPHVVITDLNLPVEDGYQLMRKILDNNRNHRPKLIVLTNKRLDEDIQKSFELGASDYIVKPFSPADFEARVNKLFS